MTTTTIPAIFSLLPSSTPTSSSYHRQTTPTFNSKLNYSPPNFSPKPNPRLRISYNAAKPSNRGYFVPCCCTNNAGINPDITDDSSKESSINLQLPRRRLLVQFTCDACGEKTKRLINRLAYERGTVFVQCAGCLQHHKLVDNLGLVVEYDFRNETDEV